MALSGDEFLQNIRLQSPSAALLTDRIINHINNMAMQLGVDGAGKVDPPNPPSAVTVSAGDGIVHVTHTDNSVVTKPVNYFTEWSNDKGLTWNMVHHGPSRQATISLAAMDMTSTPHSYIFRGYTQHLGSDASPSTYFGGAANPTAVTVSGTTKLNYLPATGGGTSAPTGQQGGQGFGTALTRPPLSPKRANLNTQGQ